MATKKTLSPDSKLELKTSKLPQKETLENSQLSLKQTNQNSSSCCSSAKKLPPSHEQNNPKSESSSPKISMTLASPKKSCCMGTSTCENLGSTADQFTQKHGTATSPLPATITNQSLAKNKQELKKGPKTRVVIKHDVGFNNFLTLRGKGGGLSWEKGTSLTNVKHDEWVWETETSFTTCEFKVLINDSHYEIGENHPISCGASFQYTPQF